ncbi:MAG: 3'(2'),5'-bisphosphate nucleotidase CysQ [Erysipelotrichaceae bacterium]|nr:3'(2'),5'-bisphosphate nucleotidase CysQ [Erysipelotrichaceae bacterium]
MFKKELEKMIEACQKAKVEIMKIYNQGFDVEIKDDDSPVTLADKTADKMIKEILQKEFPSYAFLTEESEDDLSRRSNDYLFVVDPVDGTKDFVAKDDMFTTNVALVYKEEVVAGVVYVPARDEYYFALKGQGAYYCKEGQEPIKIHVNDKLDNLTMLISVFHTTEKERIIIEDHKDKITTVEKYGSAIKACRIAQGLAEVSFRLGSGTKEWDTAASQIVVLEAGGVFAKPDLTPITYNRVDVYNREGFVVLNRKENLLIK